MESVYTALDSPSVSSGTVPLLSRLRHASFTLPENRTHRDNPGRRPRPDAETTHYVNHGPDIHEGRLPTFVPVVNEHDVSAIVRTCPDTGHDPSPAIDDVLSIHGQHLDGTPIETVDGTIDGRPVQRIAATREWPARHVGDATRTGIRCLRSSSGSRSTGSRRGCRDTSRT